MDLINTLSVYDKCYTIKTKPYRFIRRYKFDHKKKEVIIYLKKFRNNIEKSNYYNVTIIDAKIKLLKKYYNAPEKVKDLLKKRSHFVLIKRYKIPQFITLFGRTFEIIIEDKKYKRFPYYDFEDKKLYLYTTHYRKNSLSDNKRLFEELRNGIDYFLTKLKPEHPHYNQIENMQRYYNEAYDPRQFDKI